MKLADVIFAACIAAACVIVGTTKPTPASLPLAISSPEAVTPLAMTIGGGALSHVTLTTSYDTASEFDSQPPAQPPASPQAIPAATAGRYYSVCGSGGCSTGSRFRPMRRLFGRRNR
jgi:hypothetical protein